MLIKFKLHYIEAAYKIWSAHLEKLKGITKKKNEAEDYPSDELTKAYKKDTPGQVKEGEGKYKGEKWEDGFKRRVVKTTKPEHLEKGFK
jgi:hypothetical protein